MCLVCQRHLDFAAGRCFGCRQLSGGGKTCPKCRRSSKLFSVTAAVEYDNTAKTLVYKLKFYGARAASATMADLLVKNSDLSSDSLLVHLPTATNRLRQRGYDHAKILTRDISRRLGLPRADLLARTGQARQVGASRRQRLAQPRGNYLVKNQRLVKGKKIVLVDDVMTTGASLSAAAEVLKQAGAKRVEGLVFARA